MPTGKEPSTIYLMTDLIVIHIYLSRCIYAHKIYVIKLIYELSFCIFEITTVSESSFATPPY